MTPLKLELEGFTCYRQRAVIDWSSSEVELFAVTGPTGAGKSTLLDAITYALYGQTPRLGSRGLESLLSPGTNSMFVQLTFRAARGVFRVTRAAERKASGVATEVRVEKLGADVTSGWRQLPESEKVREANKAIEEIVGLDYSGFTRAVLLPQGAFDEFLRGDAGERRRLLVALLGLDRVERVRELASRLGREAEGLANALNIRLEEDYAEVNAGAVRDLKERGRALKAEAEASDAALLDGERVMAVAREHARLELALGALSRRHEKLAAEAQLVAALAAELESARRARMLAPSIQAQVTSEQRSKVAAGELERALAEAATRAAEAAEAAREVEAARVVLGERVPGMERELAALQEVAPALATLRRLGGGLGLAAAAAAGRWLDEEGWSALQVAEGQLPALARAVAAAGAAERRLASAGQEEATAAARVEVLTGDLARRTREGTELREAAERLTAAHQAALREDAAAAVRAHVNVGEACPVCGNPVTSLPPAGEQTAAATAEEAAKAAGERLDVARTAYAQVKGEFEGSKASHQAASRAVSEANAMSKAATESLAEAAERLVDVLGAVDLTGAVDVERAKEVLAAARSEALAAHARAVLDSVETAGVVVADPASFDAAGHADVLKSGLQAARAALEAAGVGLAQAERLAERAADARDGAAQRAADARTDAAADGAALAEAVKASGFSGLEEARVAVRDDHRIEELTGRVDDHKHELGVVERSEVEVRAELAKQPHLPDPEDLGAAALAEKLRLDLEQRRQRRTELASELGTVEDRLVTAKERLERKRELSRDLARERGRAEIHKQLALDLRSDRFQEYLMTRVQQRLARRASAIIRSVTDGRFDLYLLDGDYLVADAWAGGELRSARTLSGGESFVASLGLALALSDTLAGNAALGALFLDEGFGTLDRATLESVTGVLESLTNEGRMVGVITHVPELSERLPARLVVTKGQGGSTVAWDT